MFSTRFFCICNALVFCLLAEVQAAKWQVSAPTSVILDDTLFTANELSGITYIGPGTVPFHHNFLAVQDNGGKLIGIDVELSATGQLLAASTVTSLMLANSLDFEGVAYTSNSRNSVFLAEEGSPGVREYDLTTGAQLQNVSIPSVFANRRGNLGFESLTRSSDGTTMWTASEEALTVDGPVATGSEGTTVRLLRMNVDGNSIMPAQQYAYHVEKIHSPSSSGSPQSGLCDLVALPDGTLLALERSVSFALPLYLNRIYEVDFSGASDVSVAPFASGLANQTYTPVTKSLLWSGAADGAIGQNLEGLALGPRLANGNWVLLGVVDNSSGEDIISQNTLVTFELSAIPSADFDEDGDVDGRDFLAWQRGYGKTIGAKLSQGDADRDGDVDAADLAIWTEKYTEQEIVGAQAIPEPNTMLLLVIGGTLILRRGSANDYIVSAV